MAIAPRKSGEAGGDERRVTRRAAIATGAAAYGAGMLWAAGASAAPVVEMQGPNGYGSVYVFNRSTERSPA